MNFIDILILIFLFIFGWIGFRRGILRTIISIFGLIIGGLLAGASVPYLQNLLSDYSLLFKPIASLSFVFFGASLGMFIFGIIGSFLRVVLLPFPLLKIIDSFIGLLLALLGVLAVSLTVSNAAQVIPNKTIKDTFSNSFIVYEIEKFTPNRMRNYLLNFQQSITNTPLPEVFQSLVQSKYSAEKIDENIDIPLQVREATNSVVKIDGIAESCSAAMTGTGFVVANERVITNAHVVAGVDEPVISQPDSELQLQGKIIFLDRNKDIAVIFVPGLTAEKLTFIGPVTPKEVAFVAGYPNGGGLKKTVVSISTEFESVGSDIDGVGEVKREVIVFGGDIKPGNSGGPILNFEGQVLGMVFAADAENKNTGYALAPQELIEIINESRNLFEPVDSGQCAKAN